MRTGRQRQNGESDTKAQALNPPGSCRHAVCLVHDPSGVSPRRLCVAMVTARLPAGQSMDARQVFRPTTQYCEAISHPCCKRFWADQPTSIAMTTNIKLKLGARRFASPFDSCMECDRTIQSGRWRTPRGLLLPEEGDRGNMSQPRRSLEINRFSPQCQTPRRVARPLPKASPRVPQKSAPKQVKQRS